MEEKESRRRSSKMERWTKSVSKPKWKVLVSLLTIGLLPNFLKGATLPQVGVITEPSTVQQEQVTMKVYTQLISSIPSSGRVEMTLAPEMSISKTSFTCNLNIPSTVKATCAQTGTNKITATFDAGIPSGSFELQINQAIKNPSSTTPTSSFLFYSYTGTGQILDQLTSGINLVATVGSFISSSLASEDQRVGVTTNLVVRFTGNHKIPSNGQIQMTFPKWNPESPTSQLEYLQGAIACASNSPSLQSSIQCSFSNSVLTVTNLAASEINGGTEISFKIQGFRNPLSTSLITGFQLLTLDQAGGQIDITTSTTLKISLPAPITQSAFSVDPSTDRTVAGIVGETNIMQVSFSSPVPLNQGCKIRITLPSQFNLETITKITISGLLGAQSSIPVTKTGLTFSFSSCASYRANQLQAIIVIESLTLPGYTKATSNMNIEIRDRNDNQIAATQTGPTFTPTAGTGLQVAFTVSPTTILSSSDLTFEVRPQRALGLVGQFVLQFNERYDLNPGVCSTYQAISSLVKSTSQCSFTDSQLILTDFITRTIDKNSGTILQFKVGKVILPSTIGTRSFLGWIRQQDPTDKQFYNVESFTGQISHTITNGKIDATVTPATFTAYETTSYTFAITPEHPVDINGVIVINYPKNITIPDASFSQSQCRGFVGFPTTPTCVINPVTRTLTINNGFRVAPTSGTRTYQFTLPGIVNPLTLDPTDTFKMQTMTLDGSIMDVLTSGLTIQMKKVPFIRSVLVEPASLTNSAITRYNFIVTSTVPVNSTYSVILKFPPEVKLPSDPSMYKCASDDINLIAGIQCTNHQAFILNSIRMQLTIKAPLLGINPLQPFRLTINGIKNPQTTKRSSSFEVLITDAQLGIVSSLNTDANPVTVMTNTPNTMKKAEFSANTTGAGQNAKYTIKIYPEYPIEKGGGVIIVYPSQIGVQSSIVATISSIATKADPTVIVERSARRISILNAFAIQQPADGQAITITLEGFVNPLFNQEKTNSFDVKTVNVEGPSVFFIDQVIDGLILNSPCDYPCSTCPADKPSLCLSCYQTTELNKLQGETCVSECSTGKYHNITAGACLNCSSTCLACVDNPNKCTQCGIGDYLFLYDNKCLTDCPDGWVNDSSKNRCNKCVNNCKTCKFTDTTCTSCFTDKAYPFFYQANCYQTCPADISVPLSNFQCSDCDPSCKTCKDLPNKCMTCLSHMRYDPVKFTCTSVCQEGVQIYDSKKGQCLNCDPNCATCAGNTTTCTSCRSGLVLNSDNTCKASCAFDNQIPLLGVCKTCELPCSQCKGSLSRCTKCQGDYLLYNATCVQYCPLKFRADNTTRQCVFEGLICPEGFHVNEAGDGCIPNEFECPPGYEINLQKTACVPKPGSIVPFPFLFLSSCLGILVVGSYIKDKFFTKVTTNLIALIGMQEMLIYALIVCYSGAMTLWIPFILSGAALLMLITGNVIFYVIYKKEITKDVAFAKWCRLYPKTERYVSLLTLLVNFKSIKLLYSGFYGLESCLAQFDDPMRNFFRPMRMITYFSFIFVYLPILAASVVIFIQVQWGYQLLILGIEAFLLAILIIVLTILEFRNAERLLMTGDEQYISIKPKIVDNTMVRGMVDVDETTLIRSKMIDDDYEIQLRKRALAQILNQVGKNFFKAKDDGIHLGNDLDKVMSKWDQEKLKLRRAFSLEDIKEEGDSWVASGDQGDSDAPYLSDDEDAEYPRQRRHSFPLSPRSYAAVPDPHFKRTIQEIQQANKEYLQDNVYADVKPEPLTKEQRKKKTVSRRTQTYLRELLMLDGDDLQDSDIEVILEDDVEFDHNFAKGLIDGVIDVLSDIEETEEGGPKKRRVKKKKVKEEPPKPHETPEFELADIMGEFEIDDLGNFIILRGEKGELLDKKERRVNRRGYLIDRFGNVINKAGQIIFKAVELDSDDEIPAPLGFEKRKKNLLSLDDNNDNFKVTAKEKQVPDDEDLIDRELKMMRKQNKLNRRIRKLADGSIVEEAPGEEGAMEGREDDDESSVDSLMAESPGKYDREARREKGESAGPDQQPFKMINEEELIKKVTKKKIPKKKPPKQAQPPVEEKAEAKQRPPRFSQGSTAAAVKKKLSPPRSIPSKSPPPEQQTKEPAGRSASNPIANNSRVGPPKRIKRDDTKELFPALAIESVEQRKLFKIAESIGGMASQIAAEAVIAEQKSKLNLSLDYPKPFDQTSIEQERLEKLKQEHFQDLINESHTRVRYANGPRNASHQGMMTASDARLPPRGATNNLEKVYGNLNDIVSYEERQIEQHLRGAGGRAYSPTSSQVTVKRPVKHSQDRHQSRRMTGLEAIYLQKFEKQQQPVNLMKHQGKAKFRNTLLHFVDDPEQLVDDGNEFSRQNEMSLMVAENLDRIQRQYITSASAKRLSNQPITSMGFSQAPLLAHAGSMNVTGSGFPHQHQPMSALGIARQIGSSTALTINNDVQDLDPVRKGNWMNQTVGSQQQRDSSMD